MSPGSSRIEQRAGRYVVEPGGRGQLGGPDLGGVPDRHRPGLAGGRGGGTEWILGRAGEAGEVAAQPLAELRGPTTQACRDPGDAVGRQQELRGGQQDRPLDLPDGALVGRVERPQRIDLVAEELDPDRQLERGREHVDDAAAPGELTAPRHLDDRDVPEVEQLAQEGVLVEARAGAKLARRFGQVVGRDGVLEEGLYAGDEDPRPAAAPGRQRRDPGRGLVGDELAALVGQRGPGLERRDGGRIAQPRAELLRDPVADLGVAGDPDQCLAAGRRRGQRRGEVRLRAVRDRYQPSMTSDSPEVRSGPQPLAQGRERAGRREQRRECREVRQAMPGAGAGLGRRASRARRGRLRSSRGAGRRGFASGVLGSPGVLDLGVDLGDVEIDRVVVLGRCVASREVGRRPARRSGDPGHVGRGAVAGSCQPSRPPAPPGPPAPVAPSPRRSEPCASRSSCAGCRPRRVGRRHRPVPPGGRRRLRATGTC